MSSYKSKWDECKPVSDKMEASRLRQLLLSHSIKGSLRYFMFLALRGGMEDARGKLASVWQNLGLVSALLASLTVSAFSSSFGDGEARTVEERVLNYVSGVGFCASMLVVMLMTLLSCTVHVFVSPQGFHQFLIRFMPIHFFAVRIFFLSVICCLATALMQCNVNGAGFTDTTVLSCILGGGLLLLMFSWAAVWRASMHEARLNTAWAEEQQSQAPPSQSILALLSKAGFGPDDRQEVLLCLQSAGIDDAKQLGMLGVSELVSLVGLGVGAAASLRRAVEETGADVVVRGA